MIIEIEKSKKGFDVKANITGNIVSRMGMVKLAEMHLGNMRIFNRKEFDENINKNAMEEAKKEADKLEIKYS